MQVFQDNCCKREIASLEVFCTNSPACTAVTTLHGLQVLLQKTSFSTNTHNIDQFLELTGTWQWTCKCFLQLKFIFKKSQTFCCGLFKIKHIF